MIDFLKESTFAVNDVINKSWEILYKNYKNIAGLCLTMFLLLWMSGFLSSFFSKEVDIFNIFIILVFIVLYFGLQLTLFKYILYVIDHEIVDDETFTHMFVGFLKHNITKILVIVGVPFIFIFIMSFISDFLNINPLLLEIITICIGLIFVIIRLWNQIKPFFFTIQQFWPTNKQIINFFIATISSLVASLLILLAVAVVVFPLVYLGFDYKKLANIALSLGAVLAVIVLIRISFFPYFIVDLGYRPFKSIRFSLAVTRGNFTRLFLLVGVIGVCYFLLGSLQLNEYYFLSLAVSILFSFIIVPLSSVAVGVVYRKMILDYKGDSDPDIIHNIL